MAEIHVERKSGGPGPLIWVVALLVLAAIAWAVLRMRSEPAAAPAAVDTAAVVDSGPAPMTTPTPPPAAAPAESAATGIVGDDTSGVPAPADTPAEGRLGTP